MNAYTLNCGIRPASQGDRKSVLEILSWTNVFNHSELSVAADVFDEALGQGDSSYMSYVLEESGKAVGWICFGQIPCTSGAYDIYWIAVDPSKHRQGIGKKLVFYSEEHIKKLNGRVVFIETSDSDKYIYTRLFYENMKYCRLTHIRDFYAQGDNKVIYAKYL